MSAMIQNTKATATQANSMFFDDLLISTRLYIKQYQADKEAEKILANEQKTKKAAPKKAA